MLHYVKTLYSIKQNSWCWAHDVHTASGLRGSPWRSSVQLHGQDCHKWLQHKQSSPAAHLPVYPCPKGTYFACSEAKTLMQMYLSLVSPCMSTFLPWASVICLQHARRLSRPCCCVLHACPCSHQVPAAAQPAHLIHVLVRASATVLTCSIKCFQFYRLKKKKKSGWSCSFPP